jgi:hypothetical protein
MEPEGSLPYSQVPATCPYPELTPSCPHDTPPTSSTSILILSSHLRLGLPNGLFPTGFPTNTLRHLLSLINQDSKLFIGDRTERIQLRCTHTLVKVYEYCFAIQSILVLKVVSALKGSLKKPHYLLRTERQWKLLPGLLKENYKNLKKFPPHKNSWLWLHTLYKFGVVRICKERNHVKC